MIELEKTYLLRFLPEGVENCKNKEIIDLYFPKNNPHPKLRIRKNGDRYEITKKERLDPNDASKQKEHTINITKEEFEGLSTAQGKKVRKVRYYLPYKGITAEIDIFQDTLFGLCLVDFEFETIQDMESFEMPEFCLAEVTQADFIAGGMLCGKEYSDISDELKKYEYKKVEILK
jgi:CYTH domain-containing protein